MLLAQNEPTRQRKEKPRLTDTTSSNIIQSTLPKIDISAIGDTTRRDSTHTDSLGLMPLSKNALTSVVHYKATDSIALNVADRQAFLYRDGEVNYQEMNLTANAVMVDFNQQAMQAYSTTDTSGSAAHSSNRATTNIWPTPYASTTAPRKASSIPLSRRKATDSCMATR